MKYLKHRKNGDPRQRCGFTLLEMVVTLFLIVLLSGIMVTGIRLAVNAYHTVVDEANGRVLLTDTINQLQNEFSTAHADEIKISAPTDGAAFGTEMCYVYHDSIASGINRKMKVDPDDGIHIMEVSGSTEKNERCFAVDLRGTPSSKLIVSCTGFSKDGNSLVFHGLCVSKNGKTIAEQDEVCIHVQ